MNEFTKMITELHKNINFIKPFGISSQLVELAKNQEVWKQNLTGLGMLTEFAKGLKQQDIINNAFLGNSLGFIKNMQQVNRNIIPITTFDAIKSIGLKQTHLFGYLNDLKKISKANISPFNQISSLQIALTGISSQLAGLSAVRKNWDIINDFEEISSEAINIHERIIENDAITKQDFTDIKAFLSRIEIKIDKKDKDFISIILKWIVIIHFILAVIAEVREWTKPENVTKDDLDSFKKEYVTKNDLDIFKKEIFKTLEAKLKTQNEFRTTNHVCKVMLKPKTKTLILTILPINFDVIVLNSNHQWIHISYINPIDTLPQKGWVLKKYLSKLK